MVIKGTQSFETVDFLTETAQKMKSLGISSVNVTKSAGNYGFGHMY